MSKCENQKSAIKRVNKIQFCYKILIFVFINPVKKAMRCYLSAASIEFQKKLFF